MIRDIVVLTFLAIVGTAILSTIAGAAMWFLPWSKVFPAYIAVLILEVLFVLRLEEILQRFGYRFVEQR